MRRRCYPLRYIGNWLIVLNKRSKKELSEVKKYKQLQGKITDIPYFLIVPLIMFGLIIFFTVFNTYLLPRYIMRVCLGYSFLLAVTYMNENADSNRKVLTFGAVLATVMLLQSLNNVDSVSNAVFSNVNVGNGTVLNCVNSHHPNDFMATNMEFAGYAKTFEKALREGSFDENTLVLTTEGSAGYLCNDVSSGLEWYWNQEKRALLRGTGSVEVPIEVLGDTEIKTGTHVTICTLGFDDTALDLYEENLILQKSYEVKDTC